MTEFTEEKLAELRAVAEAGNGSSDDQSIGYDDFGDLIISKGLTLALIAALEAKTAEVERLDRSETRAIEERDSLHDQLDELIYSLATIEEVGEWSSGNSPDRNLIELVNAKMQALERERADHESRRVRTNTVLQAVYERAEQGRGPRNQKGTRYLADHIIRILDGSHDDWADNWKVRAREAEAALERVRELHQKRRAYADDWDSCTCGYDESPCPTIQAIEGE